MQWNARMSNAHIHYTYFLVFISGSGYAACFSFWKRVAFPHFFTCSLIFVWYTMIDDPPKFVVCISVPLGAVYNFFWVTLHKLCFPCFICVECSEWQPEVRSGLQLDSGGVGQLTDKWWIPGQGVRWLPGEGLLILVQVAVRHLSSQTFNMFSGLLAIKSHLKNIKQNAI